MFQQPAVGMPVQYFPDEKALQPGQKRGPSAAVITHVSDETTVDVKVLLENGSSPAKRILFVADGSVPAGGVRYCRPVMDANQEALQDAVRRGASGPLGY
jgi:hypothetical protein